MSMLKTPVVFTANRLTDGAVVWLGFNGAWVDTIEAAQAFRTEQSRQQAAAVAEQADADNHVVEPYEMDVAFEDGAIVPLRFREQIRASGPTVRLDLGKQAATQASRAA